MEFHCREAAAFWGMSPHPTPPEPYSREDGGWPKVSLVSRAPAQGGHLKSPPAEALVTMHECCGKHLKTEFPVTAGISGVPCCWLQLSHGRLVTSSAGLTMQSSKAGLGPCHCGGGNWPFPPRGQHCSGSLLPLLGRIPLS